MGIAIACFCDIRIVSTDASFVASFARLGLTAEMALGWLLPRLVGVGSALNILYSERRIAADEAMALGLIQQLVSPDELATAAQGYAAELAKNCSPRNVSRGMRQLLTRIG